MSDPGVIFKDKLDARVAPEPPAPAAPPVVGAPQLEDPALAALVEVTDMLVGLIDDQRRHFELKVSKIETRLAEIAGGLEVLKAKRGSRGPVGPRGEPGARITGWRTNTFRFEATPILSDGTEGPPLELRELIEIIAKRVVAEAKRS
jgi:hypothetical protein